MATAVMSQEEFTAAYLQCRGILRQYAKNNSKRRADAEDDLQETLLRGWVHRARFDGRNFAGWLAIILRNLGNDRHRRMKREQGHEAGEPWNVSDHETMALEIDVARAFARLNVDQQEAVWLTQVEGLGHRDAARLLGINIGTLKSRSGRGCLLLRAAI